MKEDIVFLEDRMAVEVIRRRNYACLNILQNNNIGRIGEKERVHFCGVVHSRESGPFVFLPRKSLSTSRAANFQMAKSTMRCLAKFGIENDREGETGADFGDPSHLGTLLSIVQDFKEYGLFSERVWDRGKNVGKPDWKRTIALQPPVINEDGSPVYLDFNTHKASTSENSLITGIQVHVLLEIEYFHGWWLDNLGQIAKQLSAKPRLQEQTSTWIARLKSILPRMYTDRSIRLTKLLIQYLSAKGKSQSGSIIYGVSDFQTVWETMLRRTLVGSETGWNRKLPKPYYLLRENETKSEHRSQMLTDVILRSGNRFIIVDAKYYNATGIASTPGWQDIVKQLFYELALKSIIDNNEQVESCFVFPAADGESGKFSKVRLFDPSTSRPSPKFSTIHCYYLSITKVLQAYQSGKRDISLFVPTVS